MTGQKTLGLFDHVNHIRLVQNPDYYDNLSEADRKSFNHFMILQALSMNPQLLDVISKYLYRFFDILPSSQFYKLLISFIPVDNTFYPWIKSKNKYNKDLVALVSDRFLVSLNEAEDYISILSSTNSGKDELVKICQGYAKSNNEIAELLLNNDDE